MPTPVPKSHILPKYQTLGYPQSDVSFQIDTAAKTLFMIDLNKEGRSLTNDMQNALCRITYFQKKRGEKFLPNEYTIMYQDSEGQIDGVSVFLLRVDGQTTRLRFGFSIHAISLAELPINLSR
jgi:hypothetical protein